MSNVIPIRPLTRDDLIKNECMELLRHHGNDSGKRLHAFILDSYDGGMADEAEIRDVDEFISVCTQVFNDLETDANTEGCEK